jgi:hypothetical protein
MIRMNWSGGHPGDDDLLRLLDGEGSDAQRRSWQDHVDRCSACGRREARIRDDGQLIRRWLALAAFEDELAPAPAGEEAGAAPGPARDSFQSRPRSVTRPSVRWARAAVILLLLSAPLAAVEPVREWVLDRVVELRNRAAPADEPATGLASTATPAVVRFTPAPGTFVVVLDAVQARGMLRLERVPAGQDAVLEVNSEAEAREAVVSRQQLRIVNSPASTASYTLRLPPGVTGVSLIVGGSRTEIGGPDLDRQRVVPLDRAP